MGLPEGLLQNNNLVRVDIPRPRELDLPMPSCNEAGANSQWIPGGRLPGSGREAVVSVGRLQAGQYSTRVVAGGVGNTGSLPIGQTPPLLTLSRQPGTVVRNALTDQEFAQAQDLARARGGEFVGAPTDSFPGIDGWLDGVPTQLKTVTGNGERAILRNIVAGARSMANQGYVGDLAINGTRTGASVDSFASFVKPDTPVGRILNEGTVNNVYVKFGDGWISITQGTLVVPRKERVQQHIRFSSKVTALSCRGSAGV